MRVDPIVRSFACLHPSQVYTHKEDVRKSHPKIVRTKHVRTYPQLVSLLLSAENEFLNQFQFRPAHFHIHLLNQAYCCLAATIAL